MDPALEIAQTMLEGFDKHYRLFRQTSAAARGRFERKEWKQVREAARDRIDWYDQRVAEAVETLIRVYPESRDETIWPRIKRAYIALLYEHHQPELAETFFNSVAAKVLHRRYHDNQYIFSRPAVAAEHIEAEQATYRCYYPTVVGLRRCLLQVFNDLEFGVPLADVRGSVHDLLEAFRAWMPALKREPNFHIQVLTSPFFRNKAAYVVGRIVNGHHRDLFAIALRHVPDSEGAGLYIDALLRDHEHLANLFSVAHSYFMVDMEVPSSWISFIHACLPEKPKAELYTAVGLGKQGKTNFVRELQQHLKHSADLFRIAPGVRGMVMVVFTLPSFPFVFKVIRDSFQPPKDTTRELVMEKYRLVKMHDRVGRLADTLEYTDMAFPLDRVEPTLLDEMRKLIPSSIQLDGDTDGKRLLIRHLYIEQRMTPLDLYLRDAQREGDEKRIRHGVREFGQALRDLAAANIFPGDLLPKNFGVSPYGRVLFYDYDEVCYLTECSFRRIPGAQFPEDELRGEPWYSVGPHDIFPEQFATFFFNDDRTRAIFSAMHGDLLEPEYWVDMQKKIREGTETDLFVYPEEIRFRRRRKPQ